MTEPNFFIIGAPKCGTTSLASWLARHPEVFISAQKEPHYFATDFTLSTLRNLEDYHSLFEQAIPRHIAIGEASATYLRSEEAVPLIETEWPGSRYIVMLRNPVDMAYSLHCQAVFSGDEDVKDFETAWRLNVKREAGECIPSSCGDAKVLQYRRFCSLGEQLARLYGTVERERVLTIFLEDIQKDVQQEWSRVLAFLGLSYWDELEFRAENRSKYWTWVWVRDLQKFYGRFRERFGLPPLGWGVFENLRRISVKEAEREPLSGEMRRELVDTFSSDIDLLAELTGRDLSHWKKT